MPIKRHRILYTDRDVVDVTLEIDRGILAGFALNYRFLLGERWIEAARYDTCHGRLHLHLPGRRGPRIVELEPAGRPAHGYAARLNAARADLDRNWRRYRRAAERWHRAA